MQRVVIITGMHRSGTSLTASLVQKAGVHLGDRMVGDVPGNPHGHFEDIDFVNFHESILSELKTGTYVRCATKVLPFDGSQIDQAQALIKARNHYAVWGWKDPRSALFLNDWNDLLPAARFILIYRHPLEVLDSLLRRGIDEEIILWPKLGLQSWCAYNERILQFYGQYPDRCLLVNINQIVSNLDTFINKLETKLSLKLQTEGLAQVYDPQIFHSFASSVQLHALFRQIEPRSADVYIRLETEADLPAPALSRKSLPTSITVLQTLPFVNNRQLVEPSLQPGLLTLLLACLSPKSAAVYIANMEQTLQNLRERHAWYKMVDKANKKLQREKQEAWDHIQRLSTEKDHLWAELQRFDQTNKNLQHELDRERNSFAARLIRKIKQLLTRR